MEHLHRRYCGRHQPHRDSSAHQEEDRDTLPAHRLAANPEKEAYF